ncbi:hypothetical protein EXW62_27395 (plasmid) [Bacillus mycoides]|uniref:hypothetical protein n=1 Tax=Bacillus mycoides TaxID=1405 RepID=UPI001C0204B4|nr:hypothetical protein [Bacillus mycoides]QWH20725.1 hypothetical protein EXW62_27395 [Bacillus mycoides]
MSLVSIVANEDYISAMSDGRLRRNYSDGSSTIEDEESCKITMISPKQLIGWTGDTLDYRAAMKNFNYIEGEWNLQEVYMQLESILNSSENLNNVVLCGVFQGKLVYYQLSSIPNAQNGSLVLDPGLSLKSFLTSANIKQNDLHEKFDYYIDQHGDNKIEAQKYIHQYVSTIDETVNDKIFEFMIELES